MSTENPTGNLHLPNMAAPVDRNVSPGALHTDAGVQAAFGFSDIISSAKTVLPMLGTALASALA